MRVLAFGAHPGDIEHLCAGTLARYAAAGHAVTMAVATTGATRALNGTGDDASLIRRNETESSCASIGAELIWMGYDDEFLGEDRQTRRAFIDAIRAARPDVLFVPSELDDHPDRRAAARLGRDARIPAGLPLLESDLRPTAIPTAFVMDTHRGQRFDPHGFVDISESVDVKRAMLERHATQHAWTKEILGADPSDEMLRLARMRGHQAGVRHAEAFQLVLGPPRTEGWAMLPSGRSDGSGA